MTAIAVVGSQWGDEGKGKITDFLSKDAAMAVRSNGGNNAGHTIEIGDKTFKMRLIPSGIFAAKKGAVIGNGVVINPEVMFGELDNLEKEGIDISGLKISNRAHVIMPYHILQDAYQEEAKGDKKIGTTKNGIGPCYMDKASRIGIRVCDLLERDTFEEKLRTNLAEKNALFTKVYNKPSLKFEDIFEKYLEYGQKMKKYVTDTSVVVNDALDKNEKVLFEGAQGVMLDIDHGTYPFVTSSNPSAGAVTTGLGVGPTKIEEVIGVVKAYSTRVGEGAFPTEIEGEIANRIREIGREYGTVTGRPRRIGWFDSVVVSHTRRVSGLTGISVNLLDVLSGLETLKICTAYELDGQVIKYVPSTIKEFERCTPVYEEMPGWQEDITGVTSFEELPVAAQNYLRRIEELIGAKVAIFSVGPDREQTILLKALF